MKTEELFEKAEIIVDEYFHEFTEGRLERDQMIDAIWKLAEQYHESRMKEIKKFKGRPNPEDVNPYDLATVKKNIATRKNK